MALVTLEHQSTGRRVASLIRFEDDADVGDLYTPAPRPASVPRSRFGGVRRVHRGPLRGELALSARITDTNASRGAAPSTSRFGSCSTPARRTSCWH